MIPYTKPSITDLEIKYSTDAAATGWGAKCYDYINLFEKKFAEFLGVKYAVATSSCTGALHMGMHALGLSEGDEVIVSDTNWIATIAPLVHLGAKPVFVDCLPDTWCIDPDKVEAAITPKTKAIIAVHIYGNLCDMDRLQAISEKHNIPIIEDAAEAVGSVYNGKRAGSMGKFATFSFHGTKTITTGEGGIFVTDDEDLYEEVLTLSSHGRRRSQTKQFWADEVGYKYKMSNVQAAIGCGQIERVEDLIQRKKDILSYYKKGLADYPMVSMNPEPEGQENGAWMPTVVFDKDTGITREKLMAAYKEAQIDARVFFWPLSGLDMFESCEHNVNAWDIPSRALNLPSYHDMTEAEQDAVIDVIKGLLDG